MYSVPRSTAVSGMWTQPPGATGGRTTRSFLSVFVPHLSSAELALRFYRGRGSAVPFPRRPSRRAMVLETDYCPPHTPLAGWLLHRTETERFVLSAGVEASRFRGGQGGAVAFFVSLIYVCITKGYLILRIPVKFTAIHDDLYWKPRVWDVSTTTVCRDVSRTLKFQVSRIVTCRISGEMCVRNAFDEEGLAYCIVWTSSAHVEERRIVLLMRLKIRILLRP